MNMKKTKFKYIVLLFAALVVMASCKEDKTEEDVSLFVGKYVITNAVTTEVLLLDVIVPFMGSTQIPVPAETDITEIIQNALLGTIQCTPEKSLIELNKDNSMVFSCDGANALDAGTWEEVSATELKLNMNNAAVPSSPSGAVLNVKEVTLTESLLSGNTSVPLPKDMLAAMVIQLTTNNPLTPGGPYALDMDKTPPALPLNFKIEMTVQ